ncbi:hypothetical protein FNW02_13780 [Komarekiella sp. 'clone 1']|uniref:Uncharacterized protein n=1 Tax=Komarekiella delphini-convector SJRDD-AB1 TaxID=2593771 RepID=A0AA40SXI5_9NOST|nr:hypothetical protein [Komarekiella delphini-convector]MBD6616869.1 hypothetical protein [Komarekiella delphini-convector SJRDD-AB1]
MKLNSSIKLGCAVVSSSSLVAVIIGLSGASASAQITIQSTGTLSGTIQLPSINPNFNQSVTRVDTDTTGTYSRNIGSRNNPNYVPVYKSDYVAVRTRSDGSLHYYVDFKGIPIVSFNGVVTSPVLSGGELTPYKYQGRLAGTTFQGVVQDEFNLTKALYTGTVTDPKTGNQYQGTFEVSGYGVRYSDHNGGATPTVFDFKSDIPGSPSVTSLNMTNSPLARLTIKVPTTATLITPTPVVGGSTPTPTPVIGGGSIPTPLPVVSNDSAIAETVSQTLISPTPTVYTSESNSLSPATPNIELSRSNSSGVNRVIVNPSTLASGVCSQDSGNSCIKSSLPKQAIGPRSRVLLR